MGRASRGRALFSGLNWHLATEQADADYRLLVEYKWRRTNWHWGDRIGRALANA